MALKTEVVESEFFPILAGDKERIPTAPPEAVFQYIGWRNGWMAKCDLPKGLYPRVSLGFKRNEKGRGGFLVRREIIFL